MSELLTRDAWAKRVGKLPPGDVLPEVPGLIKHYPVEITVNKEPDPETGMHDIKFVISTSAQDRDDDVIDVDGWDLENYLKNPVVLFGHDYGSLPVAKAIEVGIEGDSLVAVDRFTPQDVHPFGYTVYQLLMGQFLRATSVGFKPTQYVYNDDHKGYDFNAQELLEHSIVPVPSNPEALMTASAKGIDLSPMCEWAEKLLDDSADGRVALWLPRETLEAIRKAAGVVAPTQIETSTASLGKTPTVSTKDADTGTKPEMTDDEEALMKEAIEALSTVVRELREDLGKLPGEIAAKVAEAITEKADTKLADDGDEAITEDDVRDIVRTATEQALISVTGKLPE